VPPPTNVLNVLNVDDNAASRYLRTRVFQQAGFRVTEAATGTEALQLVCDMPNLILLDVNLPDVSGLEVCRRIKTTPSTRSIPVMQVSATAREPEDRVIGLEGGADTYLTEPIDPEVLLATARALLRVKKAEDEARNASLEWQATFDAVHDGLAKLDRNGRIVRCNVALERLLQQPASSLCGRLCYDLVREVFGTSQGLPFLRMLETRRPERTELQADGKWIAISSDPMLDAEGAVTGAVWRLADITEHKLLEERLREAQKAESIGTLAGGIAHDFNNLLTGVIGNASLAMTEVEPASVARSLLDDVMIAAEKAADLTRQLLAYSGRSRLILGRLDLSELIAGITKLLEASVSKRIYLDLRLDAGLPQIEGDADQMRQLLISMVMNAVEAIGDSPGAIIIRTGVTEVLDGADGLTSGSHVVLEVQDTGAGMDEQTQARVFEPFFTTKFLGRGMGLAAAMGIARAHQGTIRVTSAPGQGSTFTVLLPAFAPATLEREAAEDLRGSGTILVVDDEEVIRQTASVALERYGYEVLLAEDGQKAIELLGSHAARVVLVLLDLTMPGMSGQETCRQIAQIRPGLPVVVSTGYAQQEAVRRFAGQPIASFIQKPYTAAKLGRVVKAALNKHAIERPASGIV